MSIPVSSTTYTANCEAHLIKRRIRVSGRGAAGPRYSRKSMDLGSVTKNFSAGTEESIIKEAFNALCQTKTIDVLPSGFRLRSIKATDIQLVQK